MWQGRGFKIDERHLMQRNCKDLFNETLDSLIEKQVTKCNTISS